MSNSGLAKKKEYSSGASKSSTTSEKIENTQTEEYNAPHFLDQ